MLLYAYLYQQMSILGLMRELLEADYLTAVSCCSYDFHGQYSNEYVLCNSSGQFTDACGFLYRIDSSNSAGALSK
jgi:hypothetical protein